MADGQLDTVAFTGNQHLFRVAHGIGHGLFAQNRLGFVDRGRNGPLGVAGMPGADRHHVRLHLRHHLAAVPIVGRVDAERFILFLHGRRLQIRQCHHLVASAVQVAADVLGCNAAGADDRRAQLVRHKWMSC